MRLFLPGVFAVFCVACTSGGGGAGGAGGAGGDRGDAGTGEDESGLAPCVDTPAAEDSLTWLHENVGDSVHELITCGGAQFDLMASLVPQILASNPDLFAPEVRAVLVLSPPPFEADGEGGWVMAPAPGTRFTVEFLPPGSAPDGEAVRGNLFRLDQYFAGVRVTGSPSGADLLQRPDTKHPFSLEWDGPGPLADLLEPAAVEAGRLTLRFDAADLEALFTYRGGDQPLPDLGPFAALLDLPVRSRVEVDDERHGTSIRYTARGPADEASDLLRGEHVPFVFDALSAESGGVSVTGVAHDLEFLGMGVLAGRVSYTFSGEGNRGVTVESDFGHGASYPQDTWYCDGLPRAVD